ncbi:hypothetical protein HAX54_026038, partial [Datura stramonium]|nr:hypothetical protein [Datura stramonium]
MIMMMMLSCVHHSANFTVPKDDADITEKGFVGPRRTAIHATAPSETPTELF